MQRREDFVKWFSELSNEDISIAGGKGASLAEMYTHKFPVPPGFIITADSYRYFIDKAGIKGDIKRILDELDVDDNDALNKASKRIRDLIENSQLPDDLKDEILEAYGILDDKDVKNAGLGASDILRTSHERPFVAIRSSATTEDLADASFAGQQESFLAVKGDVDLIEKIKKCFSSLFTPRAIFYRLKKGFDISKSYLAVVVQKMIDSDKSGVIFSKNPLKEDGNVVIEAVFGLGEGIVSGMILPDHYVINPRKDFEVVEERVSDKRIALVRNSSGKIGEVKLTNEISKREVLNQYELKRLSQFAMQLEEHYKKPQDIEFAIGAGEFYIVQSRPITTKVKQSEGEIGGNVLFSGLGASPGVSSGVVKIIHDMEDLSKIKRGDILVTKMTNPDMVVAMQKAAGIITDEGGVTSHAAIVSREMGIPAVVGTRVATERLKDGDIVSVDGFTGRIIEGRVEEKKAEIKQIVPTKTKIKVIVDLPDYASRAATSGLREIGLVRLESLIAVKGMHPVYFLKKNKLEEYIDLIHDGLKMMLGYFDKIWVRTSDVRSDEFKNLEGAPGTIEGNPMLGDHGIRFSLKNIDLLEAEFKAVKELADEFPGKGFGIMLPQVISVEEVEEAKKIFIESKMPGNVQFGVMVETPAAVLIIDKIIELGIDFISFGTNDLTQYTLALDRNNPDVQNLYDEMHPAVLRSIASVIKICKNNNVETSICGQAGSRPEMAKFLVEAGIDSISVNADAAEAVSHIVKGIEGNFQGTLENQEIPTVKEIKVNSNLAPVKVKVITDAIDEEALILRALEEDEYRPGAKKEDDIPQLNDAIPIDSGHLVEGKKNEEVGMFDKLDDAVELSIENVDDFAEAALEAEVMQEVGESQAREEEAKKQNHKLKPLGNEFQDDVSLDIF